MKDSNGTVNPGLLKAKMHTCLIESALVTYNKITQPLQLDGTINSSDAPYNHVVTMFSLISAPCKTWYVHRAATTF